jgi:hypothetical protein
MANRMVLKAATGFILSVLMALFGGCALQVRATGGGQMPSADGVTGDNAVFTVSGNNCGTTPNEDGYEFPSTGNVNYQDLTDLTYPGLRFHGTVSQIDQCLFSTLENSGTPPDACAACSPDYLPGAKLLGGYGAEVSYTSTNPSLPGSGTAWVCLIAPGQGPNNAIADDWVVVEMVGDNGPYADYVNVGPLLHGNINAINCPAPQTVSP